MNMKSIRNRVFGGLFAAAALVIGFASSTVHADSMSNYAENKLIDHLLRGTSFTAPTSTYVTLETSAGSDTGCGTEPSGGSFARVTVASNTTNWAATQGGTSASTGTSGTTSNAIAITFPTPSANWGTMVGFCVMDALTVGTGNTIFRSSLTASKSVNNGDAAPSFAIGALTFQIDN